MNWYTSDTTEAQERLIAAWPDAPSTNLETLGMLLEIARDQVWAFAPESHTDDDEFAPVPVPTAADDRPSFTVPIAQAGLNGQAIVSSPSDRVVIVDITVTNTTASPVANPTFNLSADVKWKPDYDVEYSLAGATYWILAATVPGFPLSVQISGAVAAGATVAARIVGGLETDPGPVPTAPNRLVYAQLQQAKNLWNAGRVDSAGNEGGEGFMFTPRPLDKTIRGIIRPVQGVPDVG